MKDLFPDAPQDHTFKGKHGARWTVGNWQCRNLGGYLQSREIGARNWRFNIIAFGDTDCSVSGIDENGNGTSRRVPIDAQDRITILGRKYGRSHWEH